MKKCKQNHDKMQYAIWRRGDEMGGDFLLDAFESQIIMAEYENWMNEINSIQLVEHDYDNYDTYTVSGTFKCIYSDEIKLDLLNGNKNGAMFCFLTSKDLYEFGMINIKQCSDIDNNDIKIQGEINIQPKALKALLRLIRDNVEGSVTVFGRQDLEPLTNFMNRQFLLSINTIEKLLERNTIQK